VNPHGLILASASPRRRELLTYAGLAFQVAPADVDESIHPGEAAADYARRMAGHKAEAVAPLWPDQVVLAADTVVTIDGAVLGKPENAAQARQTLSRLSGREHEVMTAFSLVHTAAGRTHLDHVVTRVGFRRLTVAQIDAYIASGEVWDKAGAYGIQSLGAGLTTTVHGSYTNVVGLPLDEVLNALASMGLHAP
jgi:septum formation protein